jgi:hypothetical protein
MKPTKHSLFSILLTIAGLFAAPVYGRAQALTVLRVPQNGIQPQAVVDSTGTIHLVYLSGDPKACDVMYVKKAPNQPEFSTPLRVNSKPGSAIALGTVRGAQLALGRHGRIHVAWNGSDRAGDSPGAGSPMLYSRMNDAQDGFEPQRNLMTYTTHLDGGGSVAADPEGRVYVVWHGHKKVGPQEEIDRRVFLAASVDDGKNFTAEREVNPADTGVCGCCGLKAFADAHGALTILYRSANSQGNRDIEWLLSTNHGTTFSSRIAGPAWHVGTCPMSTQALGTTSTGLGAAWERAGQIYFGTVQGNSLDSLSPISASGSAGGRKHPTFASGSSPEAPLLLAWTEGTGWEKGGTLAWEVLDQRRVIIQSGRREAVPVWSFATAVTEPDGSFVLLF